MPPPVILDPTTLDFEHLVADRAAIECANAQRHEFQLLDAVVLCDVENAVFVGYHDIMPDAWWTRGHIPGRPLFPGVLMIEVAAQLSSYAYSRLTPDSNAFLGFAGVDGVKYRGTVEPPCRFVVIGRGKSWKRRRIVMEAQGFVGQTMVFEAEITGMPV